MKLAFGDMLPDLPDFGSPGVSEAVNVYPGSAGYRPVGQFVAHATALALPCKGAQAFVSPLGRVSLLAGTAAGLYRQSGLGWSALATGYTLTASQRWRFVQFGTNAIVTNGVDVLKKINLETDVVASLGGTPPTLQALAVVNNFVVGTQAGGQVNRVAWSGENNSEWWTYGQRKSDYQDFPDGGEVTGIIGGEIGLILQRNAVRRMAYVGGNVIFRFDKISANVGCITVHSVAQHGELAFWYSDTGFKMWDGAQIRSIGFEKVDKAFAARYGTLDYNAISTAIDGQRSTVCWSMGRAMWLYNWLLDKWSVIEQAAEIVTGRAARAPTLEQQDSAVGAPDDDVDTGGLASFDAARFTQGDPVFYVFSAGVLGTFNGTNMAPRVKGRAIEVIEGRDVRINRVRPMTDAIAGITVQIDARQRLGDGARRKDFTTLQASGEMPVRNRGRFLTATLSIAAGTPWSYIQGIDTPPIAGGGR